MSESKIRMGKQVEVEDDIDWKGKRITNLGGPSASDDAATKQYVDDASGGGRTVTSTSSTTYTTLSTDYHVVWSGSANGTITLLSAVAAQFVRITNLSSTYYIDIQPGSGDTLNGRSSSLPYRLYQYQSITIHAVDSDKWVIVARSHPTSISFNVVDDGVDLAVADGLVGWACPTWMQYMVLTEFMYSFGSPGSGGSSTALTLRRRRESVGDQDISQITGISGTTSGRTNSISYGGNVQFGDRLYIDVDQVETTPPTGLSVTLSFMDL